MRTGQVSAALPWALRFRVEVSVMPSLVKLCPGWVCGGFLDDSPGEWLLYFNITITIRLSE